MADIALHTEIEAAICSACGYDNIPGTDTCEECGQNLGETLANAGQSLDIFTKPIDMLGPRQPVCLNRHTKLTEVIARLKGKNVGCILVIGEKGELIGIFTEGDAQYKVAGLIQDLESVPVESLMTPRPSVLRSDMPISQALHLMGLHGFRHVPLVDGEGKPTGFISFRDIVRFIEQNFISKSVTA